MKVDENFVIELTDACKDHAAWLGVVRFGWNELLQNPPLMMEVIVRESERQRDRSTLLAHTTADEARAILKELCLRFTPDKTVPNDFLTT